MNADESKINRESIEATKHVVVQKLNQR